MDDDQVEPSKDDGSASEMSISGDDEDGRQTMPVHRKMRGRRRRRIRPWLLVENELLKSEDIDSIRQMVEKERSTGISHELIRSLWILVHTKYLKLGQLIAFGLRQFNGTCHWHHGIVEELDTTDDDTNHLQSIRVSFAAPVEANQLKCLHGGKCHFGTRCKQSHGRWVVPELVRPLFWDINSHLEVRRREPNIEILPH